MGDIRVHLIIEGRVQGVWFRESTRREAVSLGITGWVRNLPAGTVEVLAEGPEAQMKDLVSWCNQGPPASRVHDVHMNQEEWKGEFVSFDVVF